MTQYKYIYAISNKCDISEKEQAIKKNFHFKT